MAAVSVKRSIIVLAAEPREEWVQVNCKIPAWRRKKVAPARTYRQLRRLSEKNLGPEPVIKIMK